MVNIVTVCVDYDDFLSLCLPTWKRFTDLITVVTTPDDLRTQEICEKESAKCVLSYNLHKDNIKFNKSALLNDGLRSLENPEWIWLLDADTHLGWEGMIYEKRTVYKLGFGNINFDALDKEFLYQTKRRIFKDYASWKEGRYMENGYWGYFHLYHVTASRLGKLGIYYDDKIGHGDKEFQERFSGYKAC